MNPVRASKAPIFKIFGGVVVGVVVVGAVVVGGGVVVSSGAGQALNRASDSANVTARKTNNTLFFILTLLLI
jgi:hypothetical protein